MRLANQVFLLIVATVLATLVAMGVFLAFNLERGFMAYVGAAQVRHLDALARATSELGERFGSLEPIWRDRRWWNRLVNETEHGEVPGDLPHWRLPPRPAPAPHARPPYEREGPPFEREGPPFEREASTFEHGGPPRDRLAPRPPRDPSTPPMPPPPRGFFLLDAERRPVAGDPPPPADRKPVEREIRIHGATAGWVRHYPPARLHRPEDIAFIRSQLAEGGVVALGLLLLGVLVAPLVARRWSRPLREIGAATERVAKGEFNVRVKADGAREIAALGENVNAMAKSLARLDESRKRWIAESAHELRTPLMVLRGEIEALQDGVRPFDAKALESLAEETRRLAKLVNDLHLLAVADMEGMPCTPVRFDLAETVRDVAARFRPRAAERGLSLTLDVPVVAVEVDADPDRLDQLLANLLENSIRYTDSPGRIDVALAREGPAVRLTVEDSAPGPAASECALLFEPLYRADAARSRREGGSGLGLAICQAIARAHRATLAAKPSRLGGLAVTLTLRSAS